MATQAANVLTLADWAKSLDPDGSIAAVIELLGQTNEILDDMMFKEGNLPTGEKTTVRTGLPPVAWRLLNQGVQVSKSTKAQITESVGMLEAYSEVDQDLANLNGNSAAFRLSEASAFVEAMGQEMASTAFYGNTSTAPEEFLGMSPRYSSLSANNAQNIVVGGGTGGDNCSIWLMVWGASTVHGIFPKGSQAGLKHEDLGLVTVETAGGVGGSRMRAYQDHFKWDVGIALKDWRYAVRMPNIDVSALTTKTSAADLFDLMIRAIHRIPSFGNGRAAFYMNRTVLQMLDIQHRDDIISGGGLRWDMVAGKRIASFRGIPCRKVDALLETEDLVA